MSDADIHSLFETLTGQKPGRYQSSSGKWWLYVEAPPPPVPETEFNTKIDFSKIGYPVNDGWPSEIAKGWNDIAISIDSPEKGLISVRIVGVFPGVPVHNYLNRLQRKVERMKASGTSPFIDCNRYRRFARWLRGIYAPLTGVFKGVSCYFGCTIIRTSSMGK